MIGSVDRLLEDDILVAPTGTELVLASAAALTVWLGTPLVEKVQSMVNSADEKLVGFFGMEEAARRADKREWGDDGGTIKNIFETEQRVRDLARSRATRAEIFGIGFLAGALPKGDWKSRIVKGTVTGMIAVAVSKIASTLPPEYK